MMTLQPKHLDYRFGFLLLPLQAKFDTYTHGSYNSLTILIFKTLFISLKNLYIFYIFTYVLKCLVVSFQAFLICLPYRQNYSIFFNSSISLILHTLPRYSFWLPKLCYINSNYFQICLSCLFTAPKFYYFYLIPCCSHSEIFAVSQTLH